MHVFIDTNIFLDFYRLSGGDLEELRKMARLAENEHITLYLSDYLIDEFSRNREGTIAQAANLFQKSKIELHLPNIVRIYDEADELKTTREQFNTQLRALKETLFNDINNEALKADEVINEVFESTEVLAVATEKINAGLIRSKLGKPPGKADSVGDSIHWEWLLSIVPENTSLILISADGDFESPVQKDTISNYLREEWHNKKHGEVSLFKNLTAFLNAHFPDIELADEITKMAAIEKLITSRSFSVTHNAIERLNSFDDFSEAETQQILDAFISNNQIHWILGDPDIHDFAMKLVQHAYDSDLENEASPLEEMLNEIELDQT